MHQPTERQLLGIGLVSVEQEVMGTETQLKDFEMLIQLMVILVHIYDGPTDHFYIIMQFFIVFRSQVSCTW